MNKVWKLYKEWKKSNKHFFKYKIVKESEFEAAKESLMNYLRINGISLSDINIELKRIPILWEFCFYFATFIAGSLTDNMLNKSVTTVYNMVNISISALASYALLLLLRKLMHRISKNAVLTDINFLHIVLEEFKDLYKDDIKCGNKLVEINGGKFLSIPTNAEVIYSERMQLSKHYQNIFVIEINDNGQEFYYVLYSNSDNCSTANFIRLCKEQTGENWKNVEKSQITINKAQEQKK